MSRLPMNDPLEKLIAFGLTAAGVAFTYESEHSPPLDFRLTDSGIYIEVKRFHSDRIAKQMAGAENVIAIQGIEAAGWFVGLLTGQATGAEMRARPTLNPRAGG